MAFLDTFFTGNRERLMKSLPDSFIVITAHSLLQESADLAYPFRQDSSFYYLTGVNEPDMTLVIDGSAKKSVLLTQEQNDYQKEWDGAHDKKSLKNLSGVDDVMPRSALEKLMKQAKADGLQICYLAPLPEIVEPYGFYANPARAKLELQIKELEAKPKDIRRELARLRQIKQPEEIEAIKEAIRITGETLSEVKEILSKFKTEKELERAISSKFYGLGGDGHGYEPIVAGGKNAATIHYNANNAKLRTSDLVLLDVGAKVAGYAADISRTWSLNGKPSERQLAVYEAVIRLQDTAFAHLKAGVSIRDYQQKMEVQAAKELKKLNIKAGKYPHGFSHFLGLDVHDAGDYEQPLEINSVITVEPGLYLADEGIGVRIEDNVLITEDGIENLSREISRELV